MKHKKVLNILLAGLLFIAIFLTGMLIGGKIVQNDINKKIDQGEIFADQNLLEKNKYACSQQSCDNLLKENDDKWKRLKEESYNENAGLRKAAEEVAGILIKEKLIDTELYVKLATKDGDEFMDDNFAEGWYDEFLKKYASDISDIKTLRKEIKNGDIYYQDIAQLGRVYYAQNYFNWTKEEIASKVDIFCGGIGCNVPSIISANEKYIYWARLHPCSGGVKSSDLITIEEYNSESKCSMFQNVIINMLDKN